MHPQDFNRKLILNITDRMTVPITILILILICLSMVQDIKFLIKLKNLSTLILYNKPNFYFMMIILGIESTAHTFGIGIVKDGKILANVKDTYTTEQGGIIPVESAKHHSEISEKVYEDALKKSGIKEKDIDGIAFSQGPGLAPCLIEGMKFTKKLSAKLKKSIIPVNHCVAHWEIGRTTGTKEPVMLYASGANTQIIAYASGKYRVFGETLDIGVGNFIDNFARYLEIGFPGGPKIAELAEKGKGYIDLPYKVKGMDVAFSGILTNLKTKVESGKFKKEDLAYSMQETVFFNVG